MHSSHPHVDWPGALSTRRWALTVLAVLACTEPVTAQQEGWAVRQSPMMDLWFQSVAIVGFDRVGLLPMYQPGYAARTRRRRADRGLEATMLERDGHRFLAAFQHDSAFEIVHFLPLYFAAADRVDMLSALETATAAGPPALPTIEPTARFGAAAALKTLGAAAQRRLLSDFTEAVTQEWREAYEVEWRALLAEGTPVVGEAERRWRGEFAPALRPFLHHYRLDGGVIFAVSSLGPDGRVFEGSPGNRDDNVVVVALPADGDPDAIVFEAVRELCFPTVRDLVDDSTQAAEGERLSSAAAVRCGDLLLARYLPLERVAYRRYWLTRLGGPLGAGFEAAFPLSPDQATALAQIITRIQ